MQTILGIDVSSFRLDGGLITPGYSYSIKHEILGKTKDKLHDRVRNIPMAMKSLLEEWDSGHGYYHPFPDWVVIEDAYGMSGIARKALDLTTGAIMASVPDFIGVKLLKASEWRSYLGVKNTKLQGHGAVLIALRDEYDVDPMTFGGFDEHELDALGVALGWAAYLESQTKDV